MEKHWTISGLQALSGPSVRALRRDDIHVVYQPIVDLNRGTVFAEEALVRCKNDVFENPSRLFDQAVKEQAAGRLGRMIREIAVENCPTRRLFLNLHPAELEARWLVRPDDPIGFHDHDVFLEITEAAAFEHHELCLSILAEVRGRTGARLVIDDFGAGYSNILRIVELEPAIVVSDSSGPYPRHNRGGEFYGYGSDYPAGSLVIFGADGKIAEIERMRASGRGKPRIPVQMEFLDTEGDGRLIQSIKSYLASAAFSKTSIFGRTWSIVSRNQ